MSHEDVATGGCDAIGWFHHRLGSHGTDGCRRARAPWWHLSSVPSSQVGCQGGDTVTESRRGGDCRYDRYAVLGGWQLSHLRWVLDVKGGASHSDIGAVRNGVLGAGEAPGAAGAPEFGWGGRGSHLHLPREGNL